MNTHVTCVVHQNGNAYDVNLNVLSEGPSGGSMTLSGTVDPQQGGQNVQGDFVYLGNTFESKSCTIAFTYMGMAIPSAGPAIQPGRIWAHVSCPAAVNPNMTGALGPSTCSAQADFIFENCSS
jgi:hypothetical protein